MRPINVTLCSTTWELAKEKANFSGWVRRKLIEEQRLRSIPKQMHHSYCEKCDITFTNPSIEKMQDYTCSKCWSKCEYLGVDEE